MSVKSREIVIEGHIAIEAALMAQSRTVRQIVVDRERYKPKDGKLAELARIADVPLVRAKAADLAAYAAGDSHGGVIALAGPKRLVPVADLLNKQLLFALDGLEDPYNLGMAVRALYAFGVEGLLLPARDYSPLENVLARASAGAWEWMSVSAPDRPEEALASLKSQGFRLLCAAGRSSAVPLDQLTPEQTKKPLVVAVGGEKRGISQVYASQADGWVRIPYGRETGYALPAVIAAAVIGWEVGKGR